MTVYALGRMLDEAGFLPVGRGYLTPKDALVAQSEQALAGSGNLVVAELESVADFVVAGDVKVVRTLTATAEARIEAGDFVDGQYHPVYAAGWIGTPYHPDFDYRDPPIFVADALHSTLRDAQVSQDQLDRKQDEEDGMVYIVRELRVVAFISADDNLQVTRIPIGQETPRDELNIRKPPAPEPVEEEPLDLLPEQRVPPAKRSLFETLFGRKAA